MEQENIKEDKDTKIEVPKEADNYNFVYFIVSHDNGKKYKIDLPEEYEGKDSLEKIIQKKFNELFSEIYRFKIIPGTLKKGEDQKYQVIILAEDEEGNKHQCIIKFDDETKDYYEYDFKVEEIDFKLLSHEEQFEIYVEILRKIFHKDISTLENENLIFDTKKFFGERGKKLDFSFYLSIFLESFSTKYVKELLLIFKPDKIEELGEFSEEKIRIASEKLNLICKNPNQNLNLNGAKDEGELIELFYSILLYFYTNFQKEIAIKMLKDEKILINLSKKLIVFRKFYQNLILPKDIVSNFIKNAETWEEILGFLHYIGTDIIEFLQLICSELEIIKEMYKKELNKLNEENEKKDKKEKNELKKIDVEKYVIPKKGDNILKLIEVAGSIFGLEKLENLEIIKFSKSLIEIYVEFYYVKDLDSLQLMNNLINLIKKNDKEFEYKYKNKNMDLIIHETGIELIKNGKMKNNGILDFITTDIYFTSPEFEKKDYRPLDVLDGIDIETLDEKFFINWYKIDFNKIFIENMDNFYKRIISLIKDMKDFGLLFKFFLFNNEKEYKREFIIIMKKKYIDLFPTYIIEKCPKFLENTIKLISLLDEKKIDLKEFLEYIQSNLDYEKVNEIYINLSEKYKLNNKTKDLIAGYFATNKNVSNPSSLVVLIKNCKNLRKEIFSKINEYAITEKDFLSIEKTQNFKLYKGLIDNKLIDNEFQFKSTTYTEKLQKTISTLIEHIKIFEINYNDINIFFKSEKYKNILKEKLLYLNILNKNEQQKQFNLIEKKVQEINTKIENLEIIYCYFRDILYREFGDDLKKLNKICYDLKNNNLNYFEKNYVESYLHYSSYLEQAKKINSFKRSIFFSEIIKYFLKEEFKNGVDEFLKNLKKAVNDLKIVFQNDGLRKVNKKLLKLCLKPFKEKEENLKSELKLLSEILKASGNIDKIYEDIFLFSKRDFIFKTVISIDLFINNIKPKKTKFLSIVCDLKKTMKEKKDINTIKQCYNKLKELKIYDGNGQENKLIKILFKFKDQPESFEFLLTTQLQDLPKLQEMASSNGNNFVNINDILDMGRCIEFFKDIGTLDEIREMKDFEIIEKMKKKVQVNDIICVYLEKYISNFGQIKLLSRSVNRSEFLKYKIQTLFKGCIFLLSNNIIEFEDKKELLFECFYEEQFKEETKKIYLSKEELISLRDRALLVKDMTPDYQYFITSISRIINISHILKGIYDKGYPKIINIKIAYKVNVINKPIKENLTEMELDPKIKYFIDGKYRNNCEEIIAELNNILSIIEEKQINGYKTLPLIRYLYGRQFNLLYDYLDENISNKIEPLLKYISNDSIKKKLDKFEIKKEGDIIENSIQDWNDYLNKLFKINKLSLEKIYKPTLIKKENININSGIYTIVYEKPEKKLFQIYKFITGNNPIAQNILLCNKKTSNEEITAFLYRAILCEYNSCFIITGLESLEIETKSTILELLNNFFLSGKENVKMNSCFIFLFHNYNSDIYKSLEMKKYRNILNINEKQIENQKYGENDIEIIKSDKSGVGKSTKIDLEIKKMKKKRIYFPFGGAFSQENIISRLKNLKIDDNSVLHLDLYDSDKTDLMMEFLFSILINRFYGQKEDLFFLSKNIHIKVEIPNTFINFFEKFSVLNLFTVKEIKIAELESLIVPDKISCDIEIVANYLKALKENKINYYDFIFPDITPSYFSNRKFSNNTTTCLKPELIHPKECQNLIFEMIKNKIKEPNYYQIISFINVLAVQLKKFNQNAYLNAFVLIGNGKSRILPIRTFIVKSFIALTSHFTEGAFSELLKSQQVVSETKFGMYDEKNDVNCAISNLAREVKDVISFDKIDPSLVFFHEKESELFSIITNKSKNDNEYKELLNLKNSQLEEGQKGVKELPNYKKYKQIDFLRELKEILYITTPLTKAEIKENEERKSLEEITGDYVITADNFVKMVLILLRIRSRIPVIMMGETGCGKTSLIRKLSEMKNDGDKTKMKILNIHAGTNDDDIIKFIKEKVIPEAKKITEDEAEKKKNYLKNQQLFEDTKLWVFLDEINTCKSMGLISELMCKHTCQGSPLPENIVFIAACNPYRLREKKTGLKQEKIGLDIEQAHNQIKKLNTKEIEDIKSNKDCDLVYSVNPLPHPLLNFVFYFGKLKPDDEKNYIKCIIKKDIEKIYYKDKSPIEEKHEDNKIKKLKELACEMIWDAQEYIRENNDISSVSLREIRRVNIFYKFFYNYLNSKKDFYLNENQIELDEEDSEFFENLDDYSMQIYALNLSIFVCYYLRITDKRQRNELNQKMTAILNKFDSKFREKEFLDLPLKEEQFIVKNINLDKGIAQNRALKENIFSLFVAINTKVPVFIVGKPGCSKSLSFQLITKSMQGSTSENPFFKKLQKPIIHAYQGSLACTSKGVENVFKRARETLKQLREEDKNKYISLIYFDEMGLAEHSPNNPLKVIHAELEYDQNEDDKQVAFVGISNWNLDAAKMNRGISISIPEPDEEDVKETALTIGNSFDEALALRNKSFLENLGISYYNYKQYLKKNHSLDGKEDFHGNRDFYHLIKISVRTMMDKEKQNLLNDQTILECAIDSIERNFSGIQFDDDHKTSLNL